MSRSKIDLAAVSRSKFRPLITLWIFEGWQNGRSWTLVQDGFDILRIFRFCRKFYKALSPLSFNERSVCFASCKTLGVQLRASMPALEKGEMSWHGTTFLKAVFDICEVTELIENTFVAMTEGIVIAKKF